MITSKREGVFLGFLTNHKIRIKGTVAIFVRPNWWIQLNLKNVVWSRFCTAVTLILTVLASLISFSFWYSVISRFFTLPNVALQPILPGPPGPPVISLWDTDEPDELPEEAPFGVPRRMSVTLDTVYYNILVCYKFRYWFQRIWFMKMSLKAENLWSIPWLFGWCIWKWLLEVAYGQMSFEASGIVDACF